MNQLPYANQPDPPGRFIDAYLRVCGATLAAEARRNIHESVVGTTRLRLFDPST
jgi:hypothetical protein